MCPTNVFNNKIYTLFKLDMGGSKLKGVYKNKMVVYVNTILFTTRASKYQVMEDLLDTYMMAKRPLLYY